MSDKIILIASALAIFLTQCTPGNLPASAIAPKQTPLPHPSETQLPFDTVFKGKSKFQTIMKKAYQENWQNLDIGSRTAKFAEVLTDTPYVNFTLEVDDKIESPVVNLNAMDCWTFYENALAMARLIKRQSPPYQPKDMLHMIEVERYRNGHCTGNYLSRMHHLEEVFHDNERRGYSMNITRQIPGAERLHRTVTEMTTQWKSYRYLRSNPDLLKPMAKIENRISKLPVWHIPKRNVRVAEAYLTDGDICAITTHKTYQYTSHVGLIVKKNGRAYFAHATASRSKGRKTLIDRPITDYLMENSLHAGIIVSRPFDLPQ